MIQLRCRHLVVALITLLVPISLNAQQSDKGAIEATIRAYEQAVQDFDFDKANSLLAPDAVWIEEDSAPAPADQWPQWWQDAKVARLRITNQPHDFDIRVHGDVAHVVLFVDTRTTVENEAARAFTLRDHPNQREWQSTAVESEVLIKTPGGWRIALGHTSLRPPQKPDEKNTTGGEVLKVNQLQWSPQQKEVWQGEENFFRYLQEKDLKSYMSLWDERFIGWPDYEKLPIRKPEIESSVREEFQSKQAPGPALPAPTPVAVIVFGNVAITDYFWPEADRLSPYIYRITHTWQKGPAGWHIIGGMSCEVPRGAGAQPVTASSNQTAQTQTSGMNARKEDVSTIEAVIDASLTALTGPEGAPRDWKRYRSLFDPAARLVSASKDENGKPVITRWDLDSYQAAADDYLVKTGFIDRKLACTSERFDNVATEFCSFEGLEHNKIVERGLAMFQMYYDQDRWWIASVVWERETPGIVVPQKFLPKK